MEKAVVFAVLDMLHSAVFGKPSLHPQVIFPQTLTAEEQRDKLYGEVDRKLHSVDGYNPAVRHLIPTTRTWVKEEELPNGFLPEQLLGVSKAVKTYLTAQALIIWNDYLERFDRALLKGLYDGVTEVPRFLLRKKLEIFGRNPPAEGRFYLLVKFKDYLIALRHTHTMAHFALDRLRLYRIQLDALDKSLITVEDKSRILTVMNRARVQHEKELHFWCENFLYLRGLYDLLIQILDNLETVHYIQNTLSESDAVRYEAREENLRWLYTELMVSFTDDRFQKRRLDPVSEALVYALNRLGSAAGSAFNAANARPFETVFLEAKQKVNDAVSNVKAYDESPAFSGPNKAAAFFDAVVNDHWLLATQIALNGKKVSNSELNWDQEVVHLTYYTKLLKSIFWVEDESVKLKYKVVLKLADTKDTDLDAVFVELDKLEYQAQCARLDVMLSYQKSIFEQLKGREGLLKQLTSAVKDRATRYLTRNEIFDRTPTFKTVITRIRGELRNYRQLIDGVCGRLGIQRPSFPEMDYEEDKPIKTPAEAGTQSSSPAPDLGRTSPPRLNHSASLRQVLTLASAEEVNEFGLEGFPRFATAEDYLQYVHDQKLDDVKCIEAAMAFCQQNDREGISGWLWEQEYRDLRVFHRYMKRLVDLASPPILARSISSSSPSLGDSDIKPQFSLSTTRIKELREELIDSYRTSVITKYSAHLKGQARTYFDSLKAHAYLAMQSAKRKEERLRRTGSYANYAPDFQNSEYRYETELKLGLKKSDPIPDAEMREEMKDVVLVPDSRSASAVRKPSDSVPPPSLPASSSAEVLSPSSSHSSLPVTDVSPDLLSSSEGSLPLSGAQQASSTSAGLSSYIPGRETIGRYIPSMPYMPSIPLPSMSSVTSYLSWSRSAPPAPSGASSEQFTKEKKE